MPSKLAMWPPSYMICMTINSSLCMAMVRFVCNQTNSQTVVPVYLCRETNCMCTLNVRDLCSRYGNHYSICVHWLSECSDYHAVSQHVSQVSIKFVCRVDVHMLFLFIDE